MKPQETFNPGDGNYLDLPDDQKARVISQAIARARIERSLAVYRAIRGLGRYFLKRKCDHDAMAKPGAGRILAGGAD